MVCDVNRCQRRHCVHAVPWWSVHCCVQESRSSLLALLHEWTPPASQRVSCAAGDWPTSNTHTATDQDMPVIRVANHVGGLHMTPLLLLPPLLLLSHRASAARRPIRVSCLRRRRRPHSPAESLLPAQSRQTKSSVSHGRRSGSYANLTRHMHAAWQRKQRQQRRRQQRHQRQWRQQQRQQQTSKGLLTPDSRLCLFHRSVA